MKKNKNNDNDRKNDKIHNHLHTDPHLYEKPQTNVTFYCCAIVDDVNDHPMTEHSILWSPDEL